MKKSIYLFVLLALAACKPHPTYDYKQEMRDFVCHLSAWAKTQKPSFLVIPQNGIELVRKQGIPVVLTTRVHTGRVVPAYSYVGSALSMKDADIILAGEITGQKARIKLLLALGLTDDIEKIRTYFD